MKPSKDSISKLKDEGYEALRIWSLATPTSNTVSGALLGCAIGDALGYPYEFERDAVVRDLKGDPALYSDDTQMTIATALGIMDLNPQADLFQCHMENTVASRLIDWYQTQNDPAQNRAPGNTCLRACQNLKARYGWERAGMNSAGCGTTMRLGILGVMLTEAEIMFHAPLLSKTTHTHRRAQAGGLGAALSVLYFGKMKMNKMGGLIKLRDILESYAPETKEKFRAAFNIIEMEERFGRGLRGMELACYPPETVPKIIGEGWTADDCLILALLAFYFSESYLETILRAVNFPGCDRDSVGAVAGCIAGAYYGLEGIQDRAVEIIENREMLESYSELIFRWATEHLSGGTENGENRKSQSGD